MARKVTIRPVVRVFWKHSMRYPVSTWYAIIGRASGIAISTVIPLYYKQIVDTVATTVPSVAVAHALVIILFIITVMWVARIAFTRTSSIVNSWMQTKVMNDLAQTAFANLLDHSYTFFTNNFAGSLVRKVNRLSRAFEVVADQIWENVVSIVVTLVVITIVLTFRSPVLGLVFLAWAIVTIIFQFVLAQYILRYNLEAAEKDSEATGALSDAVGNDTSIKLFSGRVFEQSLFKTVSNAAAHLRFRAWRFHEIVALGQALLGVGIEFGLIYVGILLWQRGLITVGDFLLIQVYIIAAIDQMWSVGSSIRRIYEAFADATEMVEIMDTPIEVRDAPEASKLVVSEGAIRFEKVDFAFSANKDIFQQFDFTVSGHEKVALVGQSGAGKTTITRLILRFHDLTGGRITIDGQDIRTVSQESLRDAVAFVPQEPVLFHRTLRENIRYGRRDATDAEVEEAARQAHCMEFIEGTPLGFETFVGERGIKLSGGERQRIAIARAILKNAPILILDEATSSLDSESEAFIQEALARLMEGKTVIAIAHRLSTIMKMDRIVVLEAGKVLTSGTHKELLSHEGGLYKKLWEIQAGGFIRDDMEPVG